MKIVWRWWRRRYRLSDAELLAICPSWLRPILEEQAPRVHDHIVSVMTNCGERLELARSKGDRIIGVVCRMAIRHYQSKDPGREDEVRAFLWDQILAALRRELQQRHQLPPLDFGQGPVTEPVTET